MKRPVRLLLLALAMIIVSQLTTFGQETAALQREIEVLKERVADLEKQNAKLKSELEGCLTGHAGAATNEIAATAGRVNKPANKESNDPGPVGLSGIYGGFHGAGTFKLTFLDGHAFQIVSPSTGETLAGTYKIEGKTIIGDLGAEKIIIQIIDNQTLRTTWEGSPVQLRKRR